MAEPNHLLPANATALEQALAESGGARISGIPVPIDTVKRPFETPAAFLPFLAWERSVDIWDDAWPEIKKRVVTDRALPLHRKKGTVYAYKEYLRYIGGRVIKVERPPAGVFGGAALSKAERERWLAGLPQVRVWLFREGGTSTTLNAFTGGARRGAFAELSYFLPSTALNNLHRRARYIVNGVETDTRVSEFGSFFRLHVRGLAGIAVYPGRPDVGQFFLPSTAFRRIFTIAPVTRQPWRSAIGPTLAAVSSEPERIKVPGLAGLGVYPNRPDVGQFFLPSTAHWRVFDRYAVHDGSRGLRPPGQFFMNMDHFGWPAHTLRLTVSLPGKLPAETAGEGIDLPLARFFMPNDAPARVQRARRAVQAASRETDVVLLKLGVRPRFIAGRPFVAGRDRYIAH